MEYKIGKQLKWDEIRIGQAFYFRGCHGLAVKLQESQYHYKAVFCIDIQDFSQITLEQYLAGCPSWFGCTCTFYDIPKELKECLEPTK